MLGLTVLPDLSIRALFESNPNAAPIQSRDGRGDPTLVLRMKDPTGYFVHEVHFNPKFGYMISARRDSGALSSNRNIVTEWQVEEFQEPVPGIFIAKKSRSTITRPEFKTSLVVEDTISVSDVNQQIPDSDLQLNYPAGVLVGDERDQTFNIWGGDNKPALTFRTHSEFKKWREQEVLRRLKARPAWWQEPAAGLVAVCVALLAALLVYRRLLVRSQSAA